MVLGMHRSGTSAFARVANLLGCSLPGNLMEASEGNHVGHWESNAIATLNDELLDSAGSRWDDWLELNEVWAESPVRASFLDRAVAVLADEYGTSPMFVLKDPRICRLAPFWFEAVGILGADAVVAMPIRNPLEVAESLNARDGSEHGQGLLLWLRHVLEAERASRGMRRHIFAYEDLLNDWHGVGEGVARAAGVAWPRQTILSEAEIDEFLLEDERHQRISADLALGSRSPAWVRETYAILQRWSGEGEGESDYADLDRIRHEFNAASPTLAQLSLRGMGSGEGVGAGERARRRLETEVERLQRELARATVHWARPLGLERKGHSAQPTEDGGAPLVSQEELEKQVRYLAVELGASLPAATARIEQIVLSGAQAERQIAALLSDHETVLARERELHSRVETLRADLDVARRKVAARHDEAAAFVGKVASLEERIAQVTSALRQREEEATQAWAALQIEKRTQEMLRTERDRRDAQESAQIRRIDTLEDRLESRTHAFLASEAQALDSRWKAKEASWRADLSDEALVRTEAELERLHLEHDNALARISRHEGEIARLVQFQMELEERLVAQPSVDVVPPARPHEEIAHLTQIAAEEADRAQDMQVRAAWLRQVYGLQAKVPRWWALLPKRVRKQRLRELAEKEGLFDSAAYYSRHSDVAQSGMDPFEHYVSHGIFEGRSW